MEPSPPHDDRLRQRERRLWICLAIIIALIFSTIWTSGAFPPSALPYLFAVFGLALVSVAALIGQMDRV